MKTIKTLKTVALAGLMGGALLLTGCGSSDGGSSSSYTAPSVYGPQGTPTNAVTAYGYSINLNALGQVVEQVQSFQVGGTLRPLWNNLDSNAREEFLRVSGYDEAEVLAQLDTEITNAMYDQAVTPLLNRARSDLQSGVDSLGYSYTVENSDIIQAFNTAVSTNATDAWKQGWVGTGVTISASNTVAKTEAVDAMAIAIDATVLAPESNEADIKLYGNGDVRFANGIQNIMHSDHQEGFTFTPTFGQGKAAGIGALVMQKFPTAANRVVGGAVVNSNGNALRALSPSM